MDTFLNSEVLPRRNSLQFQLLKKRKIETLLKWINLEKENNKKSDLILQFCKRKLKRNFLHNFSIPIPFHGRLLRKNFIIILSNTYHAVNRDIYKLSKSNSVGKIENLDKFTQILKLPSKGIDKILDQEVIILDKQLKQENILKIRKKNKVKTNK